ncbi:MAG: leucine-rich repeat protein [Muribaculaceae bacterium]|nr:leucine-rich repeat protein [Muribaculaceae bacterium]
MKKRRIFIRGWAAALLLAAVLQLPLTAAGYNFMVGGLCYNRNDDGTSVTVTSKSITSNSSYVSGYLVIPATVTYSGTTYSVTSIDSKAFQNCSGLTSVSIPNSVTSIGSSAFLDCSGLKSVTIPNSVTSIGYDAFSGCSGLKSLTIPNSVTSIDLGTFSGCSGLTSVAIPNSVTSIGGNAFFGCSGLTSVTIPNSVTSIASSAFYGCSGLTSVIWNAKRCADFTSSTSTKPFSSAKTSIKNFTFGEQVEKIPAYLCYQLTGLTSVTIPNSVTSIGSSAFEGCSGLTSVIWNAKSCADFTSSTTPFFSAKTSIKNFTFGEHVEKIPSYLCYQMTGLTSVTIPNSVTSIISNAFSGCSGLTSVIWNAKSCADFTSSNTPFSSAKTPSIKNFTFGEQVQRIPAYLCYQLTGLTGIVSNALNPPTVDATTFSGLTLSSIRLVVPYDYFYKYATHSIWKQFRNVALLSGSTLGTGGFSGSGSGTEADPFLIFNPVQLYNVRNFTGQQGVVFKLMADIDVTQFLADNNPTQGWEPIGVQDSPFKGVFHGENHTIRGLYSSRSSTDYVGFFGFAEDATIENLTLECTEFEGGNYTGAACGIAQYTSLNNITVTSDVKGKDHSGGFIGMAYNSTVSSCSHNGTVTATGNEVGGFAGNLAATVTSCSHSGNVKGNEYTGGFVGRSASGITSCNNNSATVTGTKYTGGFADTHNGEMNQITHVATQVTGAQYTGGFVGYCNNSTVRNVTSETTRVSGSVNVGGVAGMFDKTCNVSNLKSTAQVTGARCVGGFAGWAYQLTATDCYTIGDITSTSTTGVPCAGGFIGGTSIDAAGALSLVSCGTIGNITAKAYQGKSYTGGLIGTQQGSTATISNCFAVGDINADGDYVGGLVGSNQSSISPVMNVNNSYYSGKITAGDYAGGIVGYGSKVTLNKNLANGSVSGGSNIGGIAGYVTGSSSIKSCVAAQDIVNAVSGNVGRVYGAIAGSSTVGTPGTNEANRGMTTMRVVDAGQQLTVEDGEQHGTSLGKGLLKYKSSYQGINWDFSTDWTILETESFPYKPSQCAPPVIQTNPVSGGTTLSGKCASGARVYVIDESYGTTYAATVNGTTWSVTVNPMRSGATIKAYAIADDLIQSYYVTATVGFAGSGTEEDPYLIFTASDLANINSYSYYKVMNDIDLTDWIATNSGTKGWLPVGMNGGGSMKQLDGNGKTITGLWLNSSYDNAGLIASMENATVKNLTVRVADNKSVKTTGDYAGILVGKCTGSTFENVQVSGVVDGSIYMGGIVGYAPQSQFTHCKSADVTVTSSSVYCGGIAGYGANSSFTDCAVSNASITASQNNVGGITGYGLNATFAACTITDTELDGMSYLGGITGRTNTALSGMRVKSTTIRATGDYVGGLVGDMTSSVADCWVDVTLTGKDYVGGIAGKSTSTISRSYCQGSVNTTDLTNCRAGGIVGYTTGDIDNCYSVANCRGGQYVGGIAGYSFGSIDRCYSAGDLYATNFGGGIVGYLDGASAAVNNCFAINNKIDVSDQNGIAMRVIGGFKNNAPTPQSNNYALKTMVVSVNNVTQIIYDDVLEGISLTADALMQQSTYAAQGWDFDETWGIDEGEGYPFLQALVEAETPDVLPGDVNGDGTVNVTDYVAVARYILEQNPQPFILAAADLDGNETVNVTDLVRVAILALNFEGNAPRRAPAAVVGDITMDAALCENEVTIDLNSDIDITALQMDIALPAGVSVTEAVLTDRASASHTVDVAQLTTGDYRLLAASSLCKAFKGHEGAVLRIKLSGEPQASVTLHSIQLASTAADGFEHDDIVLAPVVTALNDLSGQTRVYGENGQVIVEAPVAGNVVIALPNGMNITRTVKAGRNVISVPARGIVIVKAGYKATKLIL